MNGYITFTLDSQTIAVPAGTTLLEAARSLGIDVPTLCHSPCGSRDSASCQVCVMKVFASRDAVGKIVPSCVTPVAPGMFVESETEEVHALRRVALELLLSDHRGDCEAPCSWGCPARLDIPAMLRSVAAQNNVAQNDFAAAWRVVRKTIPLPATLGLVCPAPCEKVCRRRSVDAPVSICKIKRDVGLFAVRERLKDNECPADDSLAGASVGILGGGVSGLSAAYFLTRAGVHTTLVERTEKLGGRLRSVDESILPREILDAEIESLYSPLLEIVTGNISPRELLDMRKVVLIATGSDKSAVDVGGEPLVPPLFECGTRCRSSQAMIVRSVADGREAAGAILHFLRYGEPIVSQPRWGVRRRGNQLPPTLTIPPAAVTDDTTAKAKECLDCDCQKRDSCRLFRYASKYGANTSRYGNEVATSDEQRVLTSQHVRWEASKCIKCGLCVRVAAAEREQIGLAIIGRGFTSSLAVPFGEPLDAALSPETAANCVAACPTSALVNVYPLRVDL
ncbi:MAG: 2Fe-2S iron-sulfur cluster-binding protein [Thermoguttaceae bacterium]